MPRVPAFSHDDDRIPITLIETGRLVGTRGAYELTTAEGAIEVPATVQALLAARIDRLGDREKQVLYTAAVIGKEFPRPLLESVVEIRGDELDAALAALLAAELVYERAIYPVAEYAFKHPLTHEVALHMQLSTARRTRHAAVAAAIAAAEAERLDEHAGLLAHHYEEAKEPLRAAGWHVRAARWVRISDLVASRRHWAQARTLLVALPESDDRTRLLLEVYPELINTLDRLGAEPAESEAVYREAIDLARRAGDRRTEALVEAAYGWLKTGQNDWPAVIEHATRAMTLADAEGDRPLQLFARYVLERAFLWQARLHESVRLDEVAGYLIREVTVVRCLNLQTRSKPQKEEEASHGTHCHRFRNKGIAGVRAERGWTILEERRIATRPEKLRCYLEGRAKSRVIVETGAEAFWVAEIARECGHEVRVVPSMLAPSLGVGRRGQKSGQRDARVLSETSCRVEMPTVHVPAVETRRLQSRLGMRDALVRSRTKLLNVTKAYLRTIGERAPIRNAQKLIEQLREKLVHAAQYLEPLLETIEALNRSIEQFDEELEKLAAGNEVAKRLQTVPGVGVVTSLRYMATLDVASRFRNGAAVGSYVGLVPSEHSSGQSQRKGGITKAGSPSMRGVLVQAAWAAMRSRRHYNDPMVCWARAIARRRGKKIAVVALARKLAGILFAMWRDGLSTTPCGRRRRARSCPPRRGAWLHRRARAAPSASSPRRCETRNRGRARTLRRSES